MCGLYVKMKRNRKGEKAKELIRLKKERDDIGWSIYNQNLVELDTPIPHGWDGYWALRDDISRSSESVKLQYIIDIYGRSIWSRRKDFKVKDWQTKKLVDIKPVFVNISESDYEKLTDKLKKYFVVDTSNRYGNTWWKPTYRVYIDTWKLVVKTKRSFKTHYREHDELLYQMESENEFFMYKLTRTPWGTFSKPRCFNRSERRKAKTKHRAENRVIINTYNGGEDLDELNVYSTYKTSGMGYW